MSPLSRSKIAASTLAISVSTGLCFIITLVILCGLFSYLGEIFRHMVDLPSAPPEYYWTATPLPTETPIPESSKEKWLTWKNLKITISDPSKECTFIENGMLRVNGTVTNNNEFDVQDVNIKGFTCLLEAPCIFGNDPSLSPDENVKNYYTKMVAPFPLPIFTDNVVTISSLPAGATVEFKVEIPKPYDGDYYCDATVDNFSH
jgi:hypothetical protein